MPSPLAVNRRHFFGRSAASLGGAALASLLGAGGAAASGGVGGFPGTAPKAKRVIYLFMSGGPAQQELFDDKPLLRERHGDELPAHVRGEQRLTGMSANQSSIPVVGSPFAFGRYGQSGMALSELLPHHRKIADDICLIRSMYTDAINHDPAITFFNTGSQIAGRPCLGSWLSYGLGSVNANLPAFIVMKSVNAGGQPLYSRLWGSGFLDSRHAGAFFQSGDDPVPYLSNPAGVSARSRRGMLDRLAELNRLSHERELDPEIESRVAQYEMAYRMQTSVPEVADLSGETDETFDLYGEDSRVPGRFAANCLLARRLAERGVRFIQLYHQGWDHHGGLPGGIKKQCRDVDQASAALVLDLKRRGMLDDTLVIWGGEFGRTSYSQGLIKNGNYGRDHHPRCFSLWMAGGGVRGGHTHGATDAYGYNLVDDAGDVIRPTKHEPSPHAVHVHDLQATVLHLLGIDHTRLTHKFQGRRFRLTDVHGHVVRDLLA